MVKSYISLSCLDNPERLDKSLDSVLGMDIDGLHLDVLSRTPDGIATPFLPGRVVDIAEYARSKMKYDGLKVDVHMLVPKPQLAVRNYKRKGLSGIILPGEEFNDNPRRLSRSLYDIKNESPKLKSGVSYSISQAKDEHVFMNDLDYVVYTVEKGTLGMVEIERLSELSCIKLRSNPNLDIMVEGRLSSEDVKLLCATGVDAVIMRYENHVDCKYALEVVKRPNSSARI